MLSAADTEAVARFLQSHFGIAPGQNWGGLKDLDLRAFWDRNSCNRFFLADPPPQQTLPVHAYWGSWSSNLLNAEIAERGNVTLIYAFWNLTAACQVSGRDAAAEAMIKSAGKSVLVGVGGWGSSSPFATLFGSLKTRTLCVEALGSAVAEAGWQGVAIDWEYPANESEWVSLVAFFQQYRQRWPTQTLAVAVQAQVPQTSQIGPLAASVDYLHVMTYDFTGPWSNTTSHNSSISQGTASLQAWNRAGASRKKLMLGSAWYGRRCVADGLGKPVKSWGGEMAFHWIADLGPGWTSHRDSDGTPWLTNGQELITFEDPACVGLKRDWVKSQGFGGIFCWEWSQDASSGSLARAMTGL